ncbi:MAG: hypothetical protein HC767_15470 [Akkermansiaceae bacterium]|nr:hypothetical protein [Akkermansiaceae bacterium]
MVIAPVPRYCQSWQQASPCLTWSENCMQLLNGDRIKNIRYIFRHAEAAGIMIVLSNQSYVGHIEHAWNSVLKVSLGIMHITKDVRFSLCSVLQFN